MVRKWPAWIDQAMLFRCCGTVIFGWFFVWWGYWKVACSAAKTSPKLCFSYEIMFFRLFHVFCCQNFIENVFSPTKAHRSCVFYSGFKRTFLTSGVGEMWFENGLRESTRPCCFAAAELSFLAGSLCGGGIEGSLFCCQNFTETVFQLWNRTDLTEAAFEICGSKPSF